MLMLLLGSDRLAIDEWIRRARAEQDPSGLNTTVIERAAEHLGDLRSAALAPGFFGSTRLVVAHGLLSARPTARGRRAAAAGSRADVVALLREVPASTTLILVEDSVPQAEISVLKREVPGLTVETLDVPRGHALVDWVRARARALDAHIDPEAATSLLEALFPGSWNRVARRDDVPPDLFRLDAEIGKLATAAGQGGTISVDLVAALVSGAEATNLWGLTDAIAAGRPDLAVREIESALAAGAPAEALIGQLASQLEVFAALAAAGSRSPAQIAAGTGLTEGRLQQARKSAGDFPGERVRLGLSLLREIDTEAKLGRVDATDALVGVVTLLASSR